MLTTEPKSEVSKDKSARAYVSVGPSGLVVSTGNESKKEAAAGGPWKGVITVLDRMSGFATHLDHDEAIQLAASLVLASRFLADEENRAAANELADLRGQP